MGEANKIKSQSLVIKSKDNPSIEGKKKTITGALIDNLSRPMDPKSIEPKTRRMGLMIIGALVLGAYVVEATCSLMGGQEFKFHSRDLAILAIGGIMGWMAKPSGEG